MIIYLIRNHWLFLAIHIVATLSHTPGIFVVHFMLASRHSFFWLFNDKQRDPKFELNICSFFSFIRIEIDMLKLLFLSLSASKTLLLLLFFIICTNSSSDVRAMILLFFFSLNWTTLFVHELFCLFRMWEL